MKNPLLNIFMYSEIMPKHHYYQKNAFKTFFINIVNSLFKKTLLSLLDICNFVTLD